MNEARSRSLFASLMLCAAVFLGIETTAGSDTRAQEMEWATGTGGPGFVFSNSIATPPRGESYVTGGLQGTAVFGPGEPNETDLTARVGTEGFIAKYDRDGALLWAKRAVEGASAASIAMTPRGESYVAGSFSERTIFGPGEPNETVFTPELSDAFVAKYDRDGALLWAKRGGGVGSVTFGHGIATTPVGESYMTGSFFWSAVFGAGEPNETDLTAASASSDGFVAKYDRDGALLWAKRLGGTLEDDSWSIATTPRGESYVTGSFRGTAVFGAGEPNETTLPGDAKSHDAFVAKYDRGGALLWATRDDGSGNARGSSIATTPRGESYVTGPFLGTAVFGPGEPNETVLTSAGHEAFVAKYDRDGALLWAKRSPGGFSGLSPQLATTARGETYVTDRFVGTAVFGPGEPNETELTAKGEVDVFVAKYDRDGALLWARAGVSGDKVFSSSIATTERGESYVTGGFSGTAVFGPGEPNETELTFTPPFSHPSPDAGAAFVAKFR